MSKKNNRALATIALGVDSKGLPKDLSKAKKQLASFGDNVKKTLGSVGRTLGAGAGIAGGMLLGGGVADIAGDVIAFEKTLVRFQIASGKSTAEINALRAAIGAVSKETAVAREDILAGAQTYVDLTGDVAGAEAAMRSFARISQASGASVADVATATAALQQSMGLKPEEIEAVFSGMIRQGKAGAVSLKDFAGELASLAPRWAKFKGGTGTGAIGELGAAFQVARQGFGTASEAATGLEALMGALTVNTKKFEKAGIKVFDKNPKTGVKTMRSFQQIIEGIGKSKLAKDPTLLAQAMGSKEALQTFDMLTRNRDLFNELATAAQGANDVQQDLATYQESAAGKIEKAMNAAKLSLVEAFTPERIEKFAQALAKAAGWFADIVGYADKLGAATKSIHQVAEEANLNRLTVGANGEELTTRSAMMSRAFDLAGASDERLKAGGFTDAQRDAAVTSLMTQAVDMTQATDFARVIGEGMQQAQQRQGQELARVLGTAVKEGVREGLAKAPPAKATVVDSHVEQRKAGRG